MWVVGAFQGGHGQAAWTDRCSAILEGIGEERSGRDAPCTGPQLDVPTTHIQPLGRSRYRSHVLFTRKPLDVPTPDNALPGREAPVPVPAQHFVLGTPLTPPFPDGYERMVVGMGFFWGRTGPSDSTPAASILLSFRQRVMTGSIGWRAR